MSLSDKRQGRFQGRYMYEEEEILTLNFNDFENKNIDFLELKKLISSDKILQKKETNFKFEKISIPEIEGLFSACHNYIWKKSGYDPIKAFYEFSKLFFIKVRLDKRINEVYLSKGIPISEIPKNEFKFSVDWINNQNTINPINTILFKDDLLSFLKKEIKKGKRRIFDDNEEIELTSSIIKQIVKLLQNINFYKIDEDLNGRMFEIFLSSIVRGKELGKYFTPRNVVKFMSKMSGIKVSKDKNKIDKILDGCCGSGGFLIDAMDYMINEIDSMDDLTNLEIENLKQHLYFNCIWGIDFSPQNVRTTRMNLWFHQDSSSNVYCMNTLDKEFFIDPSKKEEEKDEIEFLKKSILQDELKFDVILTNPPFSSSFKMDEEEDKKIIEQYDISFKGLDKKKNERVNTLKSNVMFIERYYDLLEEKGKLLTVIDESVLNADKEKDYRKFIMDKFIIKAVISLPRNTFTNADTTTKTSILYLRKKKSPEETQPPIFMAISKNIGHSDSGKPEPEKCDLWKILEEFKKWENGN